MLHLSSPAEGRFDATRNECLGILFILALVVSGGCQPSAPGSGPASKEGSKASAEAKMTEELDKWVARQSHELFHIDVINGINLLDYKVQSLLPVEADIVYDRPEDDQWDKSDPPPAFLATVKIEYESQANTVLTKVLLYRMVWDRHNKKWRIRYTLDGT